MLRFRLHALFALFAVALTLAFIATEADARSRGSSGSRGTRTYSTPAPTATAPNQARPMERTMTQPSQPGSSAAARPSTPTPATQPGGFFNRPGFLGGLAAGFLGAGLIGLLMGNGLAGGLGGIASFLGLLLQVGLVVIVGYLLWSWWQRRSQPAAAMVGGPSLRDIASDHPRSYGATGPSLGGGSVPPMTPAASGSSPMDEIGIKPDDFDVFERLLGEVQTAYGKEDLAVLRSRVTPEMLSYLAEDLADNTSRGVVNLISDVKLLQGDLSEAWREGNNEYATVAMRYSLNDQMVDRASGRVVEGGPDEATEVWTFMRSRGGNWVLSAIQQV
jgi:predicted lipid-binding transport protein (Tim44 family)